MQYRFIVVNEVSDMPAEVHYIGQKPPPIDQIIRVGHSGHRQLETLLGSGRAGLQHVVINAAHIEVQRDLVSALQESGSDIILDTNVAELSSIGRFSSTVQNVSWADPNRPLQPIDFKGRNKSEILKKIAHAAVSNNVDTVLAPTHLIDNPRNEWMSIDIQSCETLREILNNFGGKNISIDYPLIIPYASLRDAAHRRAYINSIENLPFDNIWMKISGFGADASPIGIRKFILAASDFHTINKPMISDCVGGLTALAIVAFGATGAICHGVAEKERFETSSWNIKPRKGGGGQSGRIYLPGLDRHFKKIEIQIIMEARGGRRLLSCHDRDCCPLGLEDMIRNPKAHFMTQRKKQLTDIEKTTTEHRVKRFIDHHLTGANRVARQASRLKIEDETITESLNRVPIRLDKMREVLEDLEQTIGTNCSRSKPLEVRTTVQERAKEKRS